MTTSDLKLTIFRQIDTLPVYLLQDVELYLQNIMQKAQSFTQENDTIQKKERQLGCLKGIVAYMADDFDAPLEDFKDYM
jgi:hypothetical protein